MKRRVFSGFVIPLALALLTSLVVFRIVSTYDRDFARVNETSRTSAQLSTLIKTVIDAETGQRGFAITGDRAFLEPYLSSTTEFGVTLSALRGSLNSADRGTLNEIDALFERWRREVAEVVIGARRQAPVGLDAALRGASTAFTEARATAVRYRLANEPFLLSRSGRLLGEVEQELGRALQLGVNGPQRAAVRAAAAQVEEYRRENSVDLALSEAQALDDTLAELATDAEAAEIKVTAQIRAGAGKRLIDEIRTQVADLSGEVNTTLERTLAASTAATRRTRWVAFFGPLSAALLSLLAIVQSQRQLSRSIRKLAAAAREFAKGQLERRLTLAHGDELRPLAEDFNLMADRLSERERQNTRLGQFSSTLQTCLTTGEAYRIAERFGPQLFGTLSGTLYLIDGSRNLLETVSSWGEGPSGSRRKPRRPRPDRLLGAAPEQTVTRRRGAGASSARTRPLRHPPKACAYRLGDQNETVGLLYLFSYDPRRSPDRRHRTLCRDGRRTVLPWALSNLRLRESLKQQSVRDPLTGLYNPAASGGDVGARAAPRSSTKRTLERVMFDVDYFKRYKRYLRSRRGRHRTARAQRRG